MILLLKPDFIVFLVLLFLLIYFFVTVTITSLHKVYLFFHFCMMQWSLLQFLISTVNSRELQLFFLKAAFVDLSMVAIGWLAFTIFLTGHSAFLRSRASLLIYIPVLLAAIGIMLNPHGLFALPSPTDVSRRIYGPIFWMTVVFLFGYIAASVMIISRALKSDLTSRSKKAIKQVLYGISILSLLALLDILLNVVFSAWLPIIPGLTSLGIFMSVTLFVISLHRDKVLDIAIIAHKDIVNMIQQGIMVLDENEIIMDMNKSLRSQVGLKISDRFDMHAFLSRAYVAEGLDSFLEHYQRYPMTKGKLEFVYDPLKQHCMTIHVSPVIVHGERIGRIVTFEDVSEIYHLLEKSSLQNQALREQNKSLTRIRDELSQTNAKLEQLAVIDSLTGCYNRHYLTQRLEHEVLKNQSQRIPFALLLLDIDRFKVVNDQYGHLVGDAVICSTVNVILQALLPQDIVARYGGEELLIYLPQADEGDADVLAERLRSSIEANEIEVGEDGATLSVTVSMGMLSIEPSGEMPALYLKDLLAAATRRSIKRNGRGAIGLSAEGHDPARRP
ncbi:histidine kinase N-terminal 7TM domain-containing diguanylate cyclase [Paenibacillus cremeus]|uniref:Diguanylate cyclase n=1 Tax=Paenibacillus cremeus TaxID=2163881 RepID=A0A559KIN4_9BACL|nr:GGDEF domain-containing protein [Paenibacillus cremeus]TVY12003.1 diguanylate cyclase [Paenibacillus cremeus]